MGFSRRDFFRGLAAIAVPLAMPEQLESLAECFDNSSRDVPHDLAIYVNDLSIWLEGTRADSCHRVQVISGERVCVEFSMNQKSTVRWITRPNEFIIANERTFRVASDGPPCDGSVIYFNAKYERCHARIDPSGRLGKGVPLEVMADG